MVNVIYKLKEITYEVICKDTEKFLQEIRHNIYIVRIRFILRTNGDVKSY